MELSDLSCAEKLKRMKSLKISFQLAGEMWWRSLIEMLSSCIRILLRTHVKRQKAKQIDIYEPNRALRLMMSIFVIEEVQMCEQRNVGNWMKVLIGIMRWKKFYSKLHQSVIYLFITCFMKHQQQSFPDSASPSPFSSLSDDKWATIKYPQSFPFAMIFHF